MSPAQTVFPEIDYESVDEARAARDEQAAQLETEGIHCHKETLYRATDGRRVFVIEIHPSDDESEAEPKAGRPRTSPRTRARARQAKRPDYR